MFEINDNLEALPPVDRDVQLLSLSQREKEVLNLLARGFSYVEIARLQQVSVHTTRSHAKNLYSKLNVHSKNEAVFEAAALGLLNPALWAREPILALAPA